MFKDSNDRLDFHQSITNTIVAAIEAGAGDARLPWHRTGASSILPENVATSNAYNGINVVALWATAQERAYTHSLWARTNNSNPSTPKSARARRRHSSFSTKNTTSSPTRNKNDDGRRRSSRKPRGCSTSRKSTATPSASRYRRYHHWSATREPRRSSSRRKPRSVSVARAPTTGSTDHIQMPDEHLFRESDSEHERKTGTGAHARARPLSADTRNGSTDNSAKVSRGNDRTPWSLLLPPSAGVYVPVLARALGRRAALHDGTLVLGRRLVRDPVTGGPSRPRR